MQINKPEDVVSMPISELTDSQFLAFLEGRDAYHSGDECWRQFHDTKICWDAGYLWEQGRQKV